MRTRYIDVDDVAVHYLHSGQSSLPGARPALDQGELLVLLHSAGENAALWREEVEILGRSHSVLALDLPGHGRSGGTEGLPSMAEYAVFVSSFVHALDLRPFVLIGKGMGASIALHYGAAHAKRLRGIVLLAADSNPSVPDDTLTGWRDVMQGRAPQPFSKDLFSPATSFEIMKKIWTEQVRTDPRVRYHDLVAWSEDDFGDRLSDVRPPVLVIAGADDRIVSPAASQELCPRLPNARMEVIERAGHVAELEQPQELAARIEKFIHSIDRDT